MHCQRGDRTTQDDGHEDDSCDQNEPDGVFDVHDGGVSLRRRHVI
jgi:hypothetical protein